MDLSELGSFWDESVGEIFVFSFWMIRHKELCSYAEMHITINMIKGIISLEGIAALKETARAIKANKQLKINRAPAIFFSETPIFTINPSEPLQLFGI
jgi:hypothetical protein